MKYFVWKNIWSEKRFILLKWLFWWGVYMERERERGGGGGINVIYLAGDKRSSLDADMGNVF